MALYYSTCLRNRLLGLQGTIVYHPPAVTTAYVAVGATSPNTITDSTNGFITEGFHEGMMIYTYGSTTAGNNITAGVELTEVAAGTLSFAANTITTAQAFLTTTYLIGCKGGSLRDIIAGGVIDCFSGSIPATADAAVSGSLVCRIMCGGTSGWAAGSPLYGLFLGAAADGSIAKASGTWAGIGLINPSGVMTFFRWKGNATDADGADTTYIYPRIQGTIGVGSSYNMNVVSTTLALNATLTIDSATFTPAAYV